MYDRECTCRTGCPPLLRDRGRTAADAPRRRGTTRISNNDYYATVRDAMRCVRGPYECLLKCNVPRPASVSPKEVKHCVRNLGAWQPATCGHHRRTSWHAHPHRRRHEACNVRASAPSGRSVAPSLHEHAPPLLACRRAAQARARATTIGVLASCASEGVRGQGRGLATRPGRARPVGCAAWCDARAAQPCGVDEDGSGV